MSYAALQEGVYKCALSWSSTLSRGRCRGSRSHPTSALCPRIEGFRYGGWVTFVTTAWFCVCGLVELLLSGSFVRKGAWRDYGVLAGLTYSGMYLTNWALNYLNYRCVHALRAIRHYALLTLSSCAARALCSSPARWCPP